MSDRSKSIMQWVLILPIAFSLANESFGWLINDGGYPLLGLLALITIPALIGIFFRKYRSNSSIILISSRLPLLWFASNEMEALLNLTYVGLLAIIFWLTHDNYISEAHSS